MFTVGICNKWTVVQIVVYLSVSTAPVILSGAWQIHAKSKDLRTYGYISCKIGAKILRLASLAQDDILIWSPRLTTTW